MTLPESLGALGLDPDVIRRVVSMLDHNSTSLERTEMASTGDGRFGGSSTGSQLSLDAQEAREVASTAIQSMADSLTEYIEYLSHWQRNVEETDGAAAADLLSFNDAVDSLSTRHLNREA